MEKSNSYILNPGACAEMVIVVGNGQGGMAVCISQSANILGDV